MSNTYAYIHIEKCAGTSLHKILEYNDSKYWIINPKVFKTNGKDYPLNATDTKRILNSPFVNGIGGHSIRPYRLNNSLLPCSFTFLRNPNKRYVSHFMHQKHKMGIEKSFEDFLEEDYYCDFITKSLSLNGDLVEAKQLIYKIGYVGIMEDFEHCIQELNSVIFNDKLQIYQNHEMQGSAIAEAQNIMDKYDSEIQKCNENDWLLYNEATSVNFRSKYTIQNGVHQYGNVNDFIELKRKALRLIKNKTWSYL